MSYTTNGQPQGLAHSISNFIREVMIGELAAISDYTKHIANAPCDDIKKILIHIMEDEKRHYGMLLELLRKFDPAQFKKAVDASENVKLKSKLPSSSSKKKKENNFFLNKIRDDIKSELAAIIAYEDVISKITDKEAIEIITQISNDEKEHVEELTAIILHFDNDCYGPLDKRF